MFPPHEAHPLRVDFFGDEVDDITYFAVADQRSLDPAPNGVWAPPCRELLLTAQIRQRAHDLVPQLPGAAEMLEKMSQGIAVEGMESLTPVLVDTMVPVLDMLPDDVTVVVHEPERVRRRAHDLVATTDEFLAAAWTGAAAGGSIPLDLSPASFLTLEDVRDRAAARGLTWWNMASFGLGDTANNAGSPEPGGQNTLAGAGGLADFDDDASTIVRIPTRDVHSYRGDFSKALDDVRGLQVAGWRLVMTSEGHGPAQRMVEQLAGLDVPARYTETLTEEPEPGLSMLFRQQQGLGLWPQTSSLRCSLTMTLLAGRAPQQKTCGRCRHGGETWWIRSSSKRGILLSMSSTVWASSLNLCNAP